jgi:trehalose 6-phosphate phosphatase
MAIARSRNFEASPQRDCRRKHSSVEGGLNPQASLQIEALLRAVARASQSLLMLDYDGTLAPFRSDPEQALPYPGLLPVIQSIADACSSRIVIISGRNARDIVPLLGIEPCPEIWGLHGLQRLLADGSCQLLPLERHTLDALAQAERGLRGEGLQQSAEFKPGSIAAHWRGLDATDAQSIRTRLLALWKPLADSTGLHLLEFDGGLEICAPEADKGDAVLTLMNEMHPHTPAAYLGDDTTDEHAFQAIGRRGLSVLVRPQWRPTAARVWLKPPGELLEFLSRWLEASRNRITDNESNIVVNQ